MGGVKLSRWTMAYFVTAFLFLLAAEILMVSGFGYPADPIAAPRTLALVHMVALGWLSMLVFGALFQFVPVIIAKPLRHEWLQLPAFALFGSGVLALVCGFLQLDGMDLVPIPMLTVGALLLSGGIILVVIALAATLASGWPLALPGRFVGMGLFSLLLTLALGLVFALTLSGFGVDGAMTNLTGPAVPWHMALGLGGWLTVTAVGVSHRLLPMFMLSPDAARPTGRITLGAAALAIATVVVVVALIAAGSEPRPLLVVSAAGWAGLAVVTYAADVVIYVRQRKRPRIELNSQFALAAVAVLCAGAAVFTALLAFGRLDASIGPLVFLLAFGWLTGLGLSQLFKIVAFLTWLESYGPVLGTRPTPRVQDLVVEQRAFPWFVLYFIAMAIGAASLFFGVPLVFRGAAGLVLLATLGIGHELLRIRLMVDVPAKLRLAESVPTPRLFVQTASSHER